MSGRELRCSPPELYDSEDAQDELACAREAASERPATDEGEGPPPGDAYWEGEPDPTDGCAHEWAYTGTAYGGDDDSYHGEGRCYCVKCGADGDA